MQRLLPIHKLLLRANGLIDNDKLAQFLGVSTDQVQKAMQDMGLPQAKPLEIERAFPLIMRRNHDILSERDVARLLQMSVEECRKISLDMDFLEIKLGKRPENVAPVDFDDIRKTDISAGFAGFAQPYFQDFEHWEEPFSFLSQFDTVEPDAGVAAEMDTCLETRMMYSYSGTHGDFLLSGEDFYSRGILSRLKNRGVNSGWMPVLLRDLAPSSIFPEFGDQHEVRIENLRKQVEKAAEYGIKIYLYYNEPRFMHESFFDNHPNARGMSAGYPGYFGMCTSDAEVRQWMVEATKFVFTQVPGLGGVVLITASENETNCYSHIAYQPDIIDDGLGTMKDSSRTCPKCRERGPGVVLGDTANLMQQGIAEAGADAEVIQWLWGWDGMTGRQNMPAALKALHPKVTAMVDWAKNTKFNLFGKEGIIGEYTLAYVRPSEYAQEIIAICKEQKRKIQARCALVTTVEMNALPYLPVLTNVETLLRELQSHEMSGVLGCWIFGAYPHRSMEMLVHLDNDNPTLALAEKYYGKGAEHAMDAWQSFSDGMAYYPTLVSILYNSAINPGPGLKLPLEPEPWRGGMVAMATERLEEMSQPFGAIDMIDGFKRLAEHFTLGLRYLENAIADSDRPEWEEENRRDYGICKACLHHFYSAVNYSEFILARNKWLENPEEVQLKADVSKIMLKELENSEGMLDIAKTDSRIGYEGSIGYFYTPMEIVEKIYDLKCNIEQLA